MHLPAPYTQTRNMQAYCRLQVCVIFYLKKSTKYAKLALRCIWHRLPGSTNATPANINTFITHGCNAVMTLVKTASETFHYNLNYVTV